MGATTRRKPLTLGGLVLQTAAGPTKERVLTDKEAQEMARVRHEGLERLHTDMYAEYAAGADGYYLTRREMIRVLDALAELPR